jgi:tRNA pseudouridine55 synthase
MDGIIIVDKDKDMTSFDVCHQLMKVFNTKRIGHTGTLDPIATGVLVCTIGKYTKLNEVLTSTYKEYIAEMYIGRLTDTLDTEGKDIPCNVRDDIAEDEIKDAILSYKKTYNQEVPLYSSVKINGKKLYEYARNNIPVELPSREVTIQDIEILEINNNIVKFRCLVSKGTYIRSLIRDIGASLNTGAIMTSLRRTKQGKFNIEDSYTIEDIKYNNYKLLDIEDVLDVKVIECDDELYKKVNSGVKQNNDNEYTLYTYNNDRIALYRNGEMFIYFNN